MIILSNGHAFEHVAGSGALAFDGYGWPWEWPLVATKLIRPELFSVAIKTLTRHPRKGNLRMWKPWECVRLIPGGSVNKVGLTNPGAEWWVKKVGPKLDFERVPLIASIWGTPQENMEMAEMLDPFDFVAIVVNDSCPNTGHALEGAESAIRNVTGVKSRTHHPVIVKLSVAQPYLAIAAGLKGIAEAVALNSVPWEMVFPSKRSPLWKLEQRVKGGGGGVSGIPAQPFNWKAVQELSAQDALPVIAPGIMSFDDLAKVRRMGAKAASFGACFLRSPTLPTQIVMRDYAEGGANCLIQYKRQQFLEAEALRVKQGALA